MLQFQKFYIKRIIVSLSHLKQPHLSRSLHLQLKLKKYLKQYPAYFNIHSSYVWHIENRFCSSTAVNQVEENHIDQNLSLTLNEASTFDDSNLSTISDKFNLKGLSPEFLNRYNVKVSTDLTTLIFPFDSLGRECVGIQTLNKKGEKLKVSKYPPELNDDILFGWSAIRPNEKEIIVTSNPLDAVAINQTTDVPAVSLPFGFNKFSTELLSVLKTFKKVIFWMDASLHSWEIHKALKNYLKGRAFFVSPDNFCSALQSLQNDSNIDNILKNVEPLHDELLATFDSFKDIVREEIMGHEKTTGVKWKRFSVLNDLMKGHRPGELTIFSGQTGTGKTTFLSEYSIDICTQGVPTLWASFEISNIRLIKMMLFQFSKRSLLGDAEAFDHWAEKFQNIPMNFINFGNKKWEFERILKAMESAVSCQRVRHLVVDNLQYMMNMEDRFTSVEQIRRQEQIFGYLREFANRRNCHVTLVIHPRKEPEFSELNNTSISGTAKAIQEADNILILQTTKTRQYLQLTKNRFDGDKGCVALEFDKESLTFNVKKASLNSK
ncbi:twinkle protein, mitochondrial [Caerostris darwini]|uniref:Twinkle protein, mitochondrial n=1 Tax=Caerostris darwini TaxID=1538125 RepID=A0AAV4X2F3_9ARAC|nr:twinkle protein, mitochondrial [Caerostris darwini]